MEIKIQNLADQERFVKQFHIELNKPILEFPTYLPYTELVPNVNNIFAKIFSLLAQYWESLSSAQEQAFTSANKILEAILTSLRDIFLKPPGGIKLGILQIATLRNNFEYLRRSFPFIKKTLAKLLRERVIPDQEFSSRLLFDQFKSECEEEVIKALESKISQFINLLEGRPWASKVVSMHGREYMDLLIGYLTNTLTLMAQSSEDMSLLCNITATKAVCTQIIRILTHKVPAFNAVDLYLIRKDFQKFEEFVHTFLSPTSTKFDFKSCYAPLKEFLRFYLDSYANYDLYQSIAQIEKQFVMIDSQDLLLSLPKLKEISIKDDRIPKIKKKDITALLKRIKPS